MSPTMTPAIDARDTTSLYPARSVRSKVGYVLFYVGAAAILIWSYIGADMRPLDLITNRANIAEYSAGYFPVDLHQWRYYIQEMIVTVHMAIWGTLLAVIFAVPLGLMASANIAPFWLRQPVRRLLDCLRSINELVFAMIFVSAAGLGPFTGVLALFVHTTGILGKLFSEAVEAIDPRPVEGIRATGAGLLEEILYGVIPQVIPLWVSYSLYRFESNVRSATVVGIVGAGGIGVVLWEVMRAFNYAQSSGVIIVIIITVSLIDMLSATVRRRFI